MDKRRLKIHIIYGSAWGYTQRYEDLKNVISQRCHQSQSNLKISSRKVNRKLAFEIYFNEFLVHSFINTKVMPHFETVAEKAHEYLISEKEIEPIDKTESCTCRFQSCCYVSWWKMIGNVLKIYKGHFLEDKRTHKTSHTKFFLSASYSCSRFYIFKILFLFLLFSIFLQFA